MKKRNGSQSRGGFPNYVEAIIIIIIVGSCNDSRTVILLGTYVFTLACM